MASAAVSFSARGSAGEQKIYPLAGLTEQEFEEKRVGRLVLRKLALKEGETFYKGCSQCASLNLYDQGGPIAADWLCRECGYTTFDY